MCEQENAPEIKTCPKTMIVGFIYRLKVRTSTACWTKPSLVRVLTIRFECQKNA